MSLSVRLLLAGASVLGFVGAAPSALAQEQSAGSGAEIIVTGTRAQNRSALSTAAPVDVIGAGDLQRIGVQEVNQALSVALPSFTFPRPGLADGTDTVRPASLRGLAPDQTLVLVNSKRRHAAALVNVNATVGRGSSAVDLNTIPTSAISAVEVLRDGASAQYGSDAIAGVINVRLREAPSGGGVTATYGQRVTTVETLVDVPRNQAGAPAVNPNWSVADQSSRDVRDGETFRLNGWFGLPLGDQGFLTISGEYLDQAKTVRAAPDWRQQYPLVNGAFDPREATIGRVNAWYGEPQIEQWTAFANAGYDLNNGVELYGWASYQLRNSVSAGFFRRPLQATQIDLRLYPDGFLPLINPEVRDLSGAIGAKWAWAGWDMDASLVTGANRMEFTIRNTLNASLVNGTQTTFDAGGFEYDQQVLNLSAVRGFDVGLASPLNVATGLEARRETYEIFAGEPNSFINGGRRTSTGAATVPGAQVFPGFRPSNEVDVDRTSVSAYLDLEANVTDKLLASAAIRGESYSDFGETATGKLALRYDFTENFALRASVQNGFRAPSLQQQFFTATSTNFINGVPFEVTTFPATSPEARALGAEPLEAEESTNFALGAVLRGFGASLTIDAYRIEVTNRIVLSENLGTGTSAADVAVQNFLRDQGFPGAAGRFFINGVDTETEGLDIVADYALDTENLGDFDFTVGANFNETTVTRIPTTNQISSLNPAPTLFGRVNVLTFERGTPTEKYTVSTNWEYDRFGATVRAIYYGEVLSPGTTAANDLLLKPKTLVDIEGRFSLTEQIGLAIGADNVFDTYPTQTPPNLNTTSNTPFSNLSPFGRSGRFIYGRISYNW